MDGSKYPFTAGSGYALNLIDLDSPNQVAPAFMSTHGRSLWSDEPFSLKVVSDKMTLISRGTVYLDDSGKTLKDAQQTLAHKTFTLGQMPPKEFFKMPQWNTWIELLYKQNQHDVLKYAHGIKDNGFPAGIIMIDDFWGEYYGRWQFSTRKFPDAKKMIAELHDMGFKVMVWVCPYVTADTPEYHELRDKHMLLFTQDGEPIVRKWWNGYSAMLDMSNPETYAWMKDQLQALQADTGVDGFKFDAGDPKYYSDNDVSYMHLTKQQQPELWGRFGTEFPYNEYRINYKNQGLPLVNRLQDKAFDWGKDGLAELIPDTLTQGLLGYYYNCPDMIGGGEYLSFLHTSTLDQELIVRSAQCAALMAMMQFSVAPWRVLDEEHLALCQQAARLHVQYADDIAALAENAAKTGEPITRPMNYDYPETDVQFLKTQFMLGDKLLVAPVIEKGATTKTVYFPAGKWQALDDDQTIITGQTAKKVPVTLASLPAYKKIN
ncbi:glycoside hydrolase family 31 protein [Sporolactobacillus sp. Y61]|uniref:Glycoside hydrolase family 31 protein n=1 Tax=Sporolactobacillus sp. Y61 TaxID=3160863 RepID=A0AAU8II03_9BACL